MVTITVVASCLGGDGQAATGTSKLLLIAVELVLALMAPIAQWRYQLIDMIPGTGR